MKPAHVRACCSGRPAPAMRPPAAHLLLLKVAVLLGLVLDAGCLARMTPSPTSSSLQGGRETAAEDEKVRLGSSPPNCRGKCYECSPCTAVQVPTLAGPSAGAARARAADVPEPLAAALSNYKPVGWKCQCRDRLYEP